MPDDPLTPSPGGSPPSEPTRLASSDHPSGDTWRNPQTPTRTGQGLSQEASAPYYEVIGDFEIIGKLGQGGMGAVYRARQVSLDRQVALKILPAQLEADAEYVARFQREARVAASLNHPNLVRVYSSGATAGCHFIAMELVEGETLADWVRRGAMPALDALRIILDVTHALDCGWRTASLIHRDIKPGNIFLSNDGAVKLGDLGLAKTVGSDTTGLTQTGTAMGTPHYISPEQARGDRDLDFRADIYSLGCTFYQMLTGRTPYEGREPLAVMSMHLNAPPPAILKAMPQCPIPLARLVGKMLKKQRRERHASYEELIAQMESARAALDPSYAAPSIPAPRRSAASVANTPAPALAAPILPARKTSKKLALYGGIAGGVVALGIVAWLIWPREEKLTAAQRYARDHAGEKSAEPEQSAAPTNTIRERLPSPATTGDTHAAVSASLPNTGWQPLVSQHEWQAAGVKGREFKDGLLHLVGVGLSMLGPSPDGAIRTRIQIREGIKNPALVVRHVEGEGEYTLALSDNLKSVGLGFRSKDKEYVALGKHDLLAALHPGDTLLLELRVQGDHFVALVDGAPVIQAQNTRLATSGRWGISATDAWFESAELQPLSPSAATAAEPLPIKLWDSPEKLPKRPGVSWEDNALKLVKTSIGQEAGRDLILRASLRAAPESASAYLVVRDVQENDYRLKLNLPASRVALAVHSTTDPNHEREIGRWTLANHYGPDEYVPVELRIVGDTLTASVGGQLLGSVHDATYPGPGAVSVRAPDAGYFRDIEYVPLDGVATARGGEPWQDVLHDPARLSLYNDSKIVDGQLTLPGNSGGTHSATAILAEKPRDGALKMSASFDPDSAGQQIWARSTNDARYLLMVGSKSEVRLSRYVGNTYTRLGTFPLTPPLEPGSDYELELRVVGSTLTAKLNGLLLGEVRDDSISQGKFGVTNYLAKPAIIKTLQFLPLNTPATEPWQDVLHDPAKLNLNGGVERTPAGLRFTEDGSAKLRDGQGPQRDGAIRMRATFGGLIVRLVARELATSGFYQLVVSNQNQAILERWDDVARHTIVLREFPLGEPLKEGQEYELELRVVNQTLTAKLNGEVLGTATDATLTKGRSGIAVVDHKAGSAIVKTLEVLDLDAPGGVEK